MLTGLEGYLAPGEQQGILGCRRFSWGSYWRARKAHVEEGWELMVCSGVLGCDLLRFRR